MKAGLYARVSTRDKQNVDSQLYPLRAFAESNRYDVVHEWVDVGFSGSKQTRPALDQMMAAARQHEFEILIVARFDRFGRSVSHLIKALDEFNKLGIHFVSLAENIQTNSIAGRLVFQILAAVAEMERSLIIERVRSGIDRARKQGKRLGRPPKQLYDKVRLIELINSGRSVKAVAKELGISRPTVDRVIAAHRAESPTARPCSNPDSGADLSH